jgi:glyoxylase-like metal-dependent hydrolase (beta-lactamase superfamily II)
MQRIKLGDVTIDAITERSGPFHVPSEMFPDYTEEAALDWLKDLGPTQYDPGVDMLCLDYRSFVVRTPRHTILIDSGTGEDKGYPPPFDFPKAPWLAGFHALGLGFADIDCVFATHLHLDHCGWNTRLVDGRWVPAFPRATYIFHKAEYAYWEGATTRGEDPPGNVWTYNCEPVVSAGQALFVEDGYTFDDTITLVPTPGHSPGHCCIDIHSRGQHATVIGDLLHHLLQCRFPGWSTVFCYERELAARSRRDFLTRAAREGTLLLPGHFPEPCAGRVTREGGHFRWHAI